MRPLAALGAAAALLALPALAAPPATSLRPMARPGAAAAPLAAVPAMAAAPRREGPLAALGRLFQPKPRPARAIAPAPAAGGGLLASLRPTERPGDLATSASAGGGAGAICGIPGLTGATGRSIPGRIKGCGLDDGVLISSVAGVALSQTASMDCTTARALHSWVTGAVIPAVGRRGGGVRRIDVAAGYACRTRNNRKGGKISEHGKGRAIDVSGLVLRDGTSISVLHGWRDPGHGPILKAIHRAACGPFKTVLGPKADRYHQDHFHFDTARRRNGSAYCR